MWLASKETSENYYKIVNDALVDDDVFNNFKNRYEYYSIVGMSEKWQSDIWFESIKNNYPYIFNRLNEYSKNDLFCNPNGVTNYDGYLLTPNTLRYINTCCEIYEYFNFNNTEIKVTELGIGYGGLCFMMNKTFNINSYTLIDLPNVYELSNKYLKLLGVDNHIQKFNGADLFISEFGLSEFDDDEMYEFYEKYLLESKYIYLHMNLHDIERKNRFLHRLNNDFDYVVTDEYPITHWPNYVIKGKNKKYE
jgi:putative sugar O-methyltransferase